MKVIGVAGYARAGKDTFCTIAENILAKNGFKTKRFSFANALKKEVQPFLQSCCGVDVWTQDSELKKDIRDFLVWYGTTFWRKRDPKRWIRGVDLALAETNGDVDFALVSDVRYPNEGSWVHSHSGYLVHIVAWKWATAFVHGPDPNAQANVKVPLEAPNEQEKINDPIVMEQADYKLEWEMKRLTPEQVPDDPDLKEHVLRALNSCQWFNDALNL